ncbi:MAG: hypothetical protein IT223_11770 [Crocinitomicaceae bacterium]|nr:hypothetical protein [Crocinitomicaceae bacterium]
MLSKRFQIIYLSLAPVLFALSWFISHRIYIRFMKLATGSMQYRTEDHSLIYASVFAGIYVAAFFVIRDLYKPRA